MKIYLCGPINGCTDAEAMDWREIAKRELAPLETLDPMDRDYRGQEGEPGVARRIVLQDKADILQCRVLLCYFERPSVGTSMEVLFAWENRIKVHTVNASGKPLPPWLDFHTVRHHDNLPEACRFLRGCLR